LFGEQEEAKGGRGVGNRRQEEAREDKRGKEDAGKSMR
jgi:hypothetical protein